MALNIAIDSRAMVHQAKSGIFAYTEGLINSLSHIDSINKYYLLFSGIRITPDDIALDVNHNFKKVILPIPDRKFPGKDFIWNNALLPSFFANKRIDLFHLPAGHLLKPYKKIKKIITIHDLRSLHINDILPQNINVLKESCKGADMIISVSEFTKQDIINSFDISERKIKTIHLGVDKVFRKINDENAFLKIREKFRLTKPFFFSLGLMPRKNIARLIQAYGKSKYKNDFHLVLAGPGAKFGGWQYNAYMKLINKLNLADKILLLGNISTADLTLLYNLSFAFVFPSLYEGFGIPLIEAMSCGAPVICSRISALPEVALDAAVYIDPYDIGDITEAMENLIEDNDLRKTIIELGFKRAKAFSWKKMANETLETHRNVCNTNEV